MGVLFAQRSTNLAWAWGKGDKKEKKRKDSLYV